MSSRFKQWLSHHATSLIATVVDFGAMVAVVEVLHLSPVLATGVGATVGGLTSFLLAKQWIYRSTRTADGAVPLLLARYLLVALASLGLNAAGVHLLANELHVQYVLARVITAVVVSNAWNYPMQRFFVFEDRRVHS